MGNTGLEETLDVFEWLCEDGKNNNDSDENGIIIKEENVKIKLVLPILEKLGWDIIDDIDFEHSVCKGSRVDCCLGKGESRLFIEVKAYKDKKEAEKIEDINQLRNYCILGGVRYGVLTDGINWQIYGPFGKKASYCLSENEIDIRGREKERFENFKYLDFKNKENLIGDGFFDLEGIKSTIRSEEIKSIISNRIKNEVLAKNPEANIIDDLIDYDRLAEKVSVKIVEKDKVLSDCIDATYKEVVEDGAKDGIIKVLSEWLKYEAFAKYSNINIEDKLFKEHIEKIYPPKYQQDKADKVYVSKVFKETIGKSIGSDYVTINSENEIKIHRNCTVEVVKIFVLSFLKKLGWETCIEEKEKSELLLKGGDNKPFLLLLVKELSKKNNVIGESDIKIKNYKKKYKENIRYIVVTNGIKWKFYGPFEKEPQDFSVKLHKNNKSQVADFLSMLSKDNIEELHCKVVGTRILDCILEEERNSELKREIIEASKEKYDILAKKLHYKVLAMNPNINVPEDYLKEYIGNKKVKYDVNVTRKQVADVHQNNEEESIETFGLLYVKFPEKEPIKWNDSVDTFVDTIKEIGPSKVAELGKICSRKYKLVIPNEGYIPDKEERKPIGDYMVRAHYSVKYFKNILKEISRRLRLNLEVKIIPK